MEGDRERERGGGGGWKEGKKGENKDASVPLSTGCWHPDGHP